MFRIRTKKPKPAKTLNSVFCRAISEKRFLRAKYGDGALRTLEPHCHGHNREGVEMLSAYQIDGPTGEGWKVFETANLMEIEMLPEPFAIRSDFNFENPGVLQIHCRPLIAND